MSLGIIPTNQSELQDALTVSLTDIENAAIGVSEAKFHERPNGKWSIGENIEHLILTSMGIISIAARPKSFFEPFGEIKRPTRSYEELVVIYQKILDKGQKSPADYSSKPDDVKSREELLSGWKMLRGKIAKRLPEHWTETELDKYCIPHPVMGLLTMREMLMFTVLHTYHHLKAIEQITASAA